MAQHISSGALVLGGVGCVCCADTGEKIPLWPGAPPGAKCEGAGHVPGLWLHRAPGAQGDAPAIVVFPGGGYAGLAMDHEGHDVARWLNAIGVTALVLAYRLPTDGYRHPFPLLDAQRALRLARYRAGDFGIDPGRLGVLGFSAGGHLASTLATHFDNGEARATDPVERQSCRPDFVVLGYPVVTMLEAWAHAGSRQNLLGPNPSPELLDLLSNERQVTRRSPPCFILHADDDQGVLSRNSIEFYLALKRAGVPAELHIYLKGGHGFGVGRSGSVAAVSWQDRCRDWLREAGVLESG